MHWSDVIAAPSTRQLRQFAATAVVLLSALTVRRWWHGVVDDGTWGLAALAAMIAIAGVAKPVLLRWVFTGAMVLAFPVGWVLSRVALLLIFFVFFTPLALAFRLMKRDELRLRRGPRTSSWIALPPAPRARDYFHQF